MIASWQLNPRILDGDGKKVRFGRRKCVWDQATLSEIYIQAEYSTELQTQSVGVPVYRKAAKVPVA